MFDKLKSAFSSIKKTFTTKTINEEAIEEVFSEFEVELIEADLSIEVIEDVKERLKRRLVGEKVERKQVNAFIERALKGVLEEIILEPEEPLEDVIKREKTNAPFVIVFLGINGTGKTTTMASAAITTIDFASPNM